VTSRGQIALAIGVLGLVLAAVIAGKLILGDEISPLGVGVEAPNFSALTLDSVPAEKSLKDFRGNVVMINIWATWCVPCRVEMPSIERLYRELGPKGFKVLAVSVDEPGTENQIRDFVKEYGLTFQILHDPKGQDGEVSKAYDAIGYPATVIIGRDGIIRKKQIGASNWNSAESRGLIERLLDQKAD
jgi:peroxiredoxin